MTGASGSLRGDEKLGLDRTDRIGQLTRPFFLLSVRPLGLGLDCRSRHAENKVNDRPTPTTSKLGARPSCAFAGFCPEAVMV